MHSILLIYLQTEEEKLLRYLTCFVVWNLKENKVKKTIEFYVAFVEWLHGFLCS